MFEISRLTFEDIFVKKKTDLVNAIKRSSRQFSLPLITFYTGVDSSGI